jgi:TatD DNase family protein
MFLNFHTHFSNHNEFEILNIDVENNLSQSYFSIAYHPKDADKFCDFNSEISSKKCLAIGECGIDKNIDIAIEIQEKVFIEHVILSEKFELPLIIHCVKAWNEILAIKTKLNPKQKWILHGFRKTPILPSVLENNVLIGIGPAILFDEKLILALMSIPVNQILLETDDNEKVDIMEIYMKVAQIKNISLQQLELQIEENFIRTFKKWRNG